MTFTRGIILLICMFSVNALSFFLYCNDTHRAVYDKRRIPEFILFLLAVAGGAFGAWMAMLMFHHKTDKPLFKYGVPVCLILNCVLFYMMGYPWNILPDISI